MESFESIWQSSTQYFWSFVYPVVVLFGCGLIFSISYIRRPIVRYAFTILLTLVFGYWATAVSFRSIQQKWQFRHERTEQHWDALNEQQQLASISDGADLVFGPLLFGLIALSCFAVTILLHWCVVSRRP